MREVGQQAKNSLKQSQLPPSEIAIFLKVRTDWAKGFPHDAVDCLQSKECRPHFLIIALRPALRRVRQHVL